MGSCRSRSLKSRFSPLGKSSKWGSDDMMGYDGIRWDMMEIAYKGVMLLGGSSHLVSGL